MTLLCFFCNIRFSFIAPYLEVSSNITFRKNEVHQLAFYWMIVLFTGLISGAYVLGKYFEEKSNCLFRLYLIISVGNILPCLLLYFFNLQGNYDIAPHLCDCTASKFVYQRKDEKAKQKVYQINNRIVSNNLRWLEIKFFFQDF